ncbi:MAG: VOC family protein [Immundisolibacteraceae bacterium]|nr:VOC family protein [Immundisolibacteraceae bacterium]
MKQITGINHVGLRVTDLDRTRAFYEKLGFIFLLGPLGPEPVAIMEHPSGVNINFIVNANRSGNVLMDVPEKHPGYTHVALNVTDLDAVINQLERLDIGLSGTMDLSEGPVQARAVFIRDPDLNVIELHQA